MNIVISEMELVPDRFQAIWNYPDGEFVYFDGVISTVSYDE